MSSSFESQFGFGIGDVIEYSPFGGGLRRVLVDEVDVDIKNGRPGFSGLELEAGATSGDAEYSSGVWGYCSQVVRVVGPGSVEPAPGTPEFWTAVVEHAVSLSCSVHEAGSCPDGCEHAFEERL